MYVAGFMQIYDNFSLMTQNRILKSVMEKKTELNIYCTMRKFTNCRRRVQTGAMSLALRLVRTVRAWQPHRKEEWHVNASVSVNQNGWYKEITDQVTAAASSSFFFAPTLFYSLWEACHRYQGPCLHKALRATNYVMFQSLRTHIYFPQHVVATEIYCTKTETQAQ